MKATEAFKKFTSLAKEQGKKSVLDIGCGESQPHSNVMRNKGFDVYTCDFFNGADYQGKFLEIDFHSEKFDAIWCSHCLEHQENVGLFLRKINDLLKDDGLLCITVPPLKHNIVGGHLTLWNIGLLYYNLILAGFDCKNAIHAKYGYNLSVILNKKAITDMPKLYYDNGDIELLSKYFPFNAKQGFAGDQVRNTF